MMLIKPLFYPPCPSLHTQVAADLLSAIIDQLEFSVILYEYSNTVCMLLSGLFCLA